MQEHLIELRVGESIQVGDLLVRIVDVNGDELSFEIDGDGQSELMAALYGELEEV